MATAIIIAGMHRSGTSATTGALRLAGVSLGKGLLEAAADNPKGYFENERAVQIHEKLLADLGRSWDDVRELPHGWRTTAAAAEAKAAIHRLVETEFAEDVLWAVKDPRICRFVPLWREVLDQVGIRVASLHVVRRPGEVAASISARNGWDRKLGELLWMRHVFEAEADTRDLARTVISYETLLANPAASIVRALGEIGVEIDVEGQAAWNLSGFVDTKDRHHVERTSSDGDDEFTAMLGEVYDGLVAIEQGNGNWHAIEELEARSKDWLKTRDPYIAAVAAKAARHLSDFLSMEVRTFELQSALNAQIAWSEEAVTREQRLSAQLDARTAVQIEGGADLLGSLQAQSALLAQVAKEAAQERESAHEEYKLLQGERATLWAMNAEVSERINHLITRSQQTISHLEATNGALVVSISNERAQWAAERVLLDGERNSLEEQRNQSHELVRDLRVQNELLAADNAKLGAQLSDGSARMDALVTRNAELEANESHLGQAVSSLTFDIHALTDRNTQLHDEARELALKMEAVNRSLSWRFTRPLRVIANHIRSKLGRPRTLN